MAPDRATFERTWREAGEDQSPQVVEIAWRRYLQIHGQLAHYHDPDVDQLKAAFTSLASVVHDDIQEIKYLLVRGNRPPWTATQLVIKAGQEVSIFATGRLWRSKLLDLWLGPQFGLWCRLGENGTVFNSTCDTNTFTADHDAELYLATQFPGQFGNPTGRVAGLLSAYDKIDGAFAVIVVVWKRDQAVTATIHRMAQAGDPFGLLSAEIKRLEQPVRLPSDWKFLWFYGKNDAFSESTHEGSRCISCRPHGTTGILQKDVVLPLTPNTVVEWDWIVDAIPSRLPENFTISHDYLSLAVEFENGRDITYHWSWELEVDLGYWCPIPSWSDREYHVVVRSGTNDIGKWLSESRNLYKDYQQYIDSAPPERILRVWLIAGSRWQRNLGDMTIKNIKLKSSQGGTCVT